jgi:hypothetical protein
VLVCSLAVMACTSHGERRGCALEHVFHSWSWRGALLIAWLSRLAVNAASGGIDGVSFLKRM